MAVKKGAVETPEKKIAEISKEIAKVERDAKGIAVKTKEDYEKASVFLSGTVKPRINRITELMKFFTDPYVEQRRVALAKKQEIEALFEKQLAPLTEIETSIKRAMGAFLRAEEEAIRKEEARLAALRAKQDERREEKGLAPIATPLPTIERPVATVQGEAGGKTTAKKVWKFEIEAYSKLPQSVIDEVLYQAKEAGIYEKVIRKMVASGVREITGVRVYEDFDISASGARY